MGLKQGALLAALALVVAACGGGNGGEQPEQATAPPTSTTTVPSTTTTIDFLNQELPQHLQNVTRDWLTDWSKATIDLNELLVGIPIPDPRDAIPPIDEPQWETVAESEWIQDREPGVLVEIEGDARFYPLSVMTRHEIVNDLVGDVPVAVTYCPLCNTALVFDRRFEGETLRLGVSGLLRHSDLVMWDDLTQSLWQQVTGEALVGEHAGKRLTPIGAGIVRWADFKVSHPEGLAMAESQGFGRVYGTNPYEFYSTRDRPYGFYQGEIDDRFPAMERMVGISLEAGSKAYPFSVLQEVRVANDQIGNQPVVVFWGAADTADALENPNIAQAAAVGTGVAYSPVIGGRTLTFEAVSDTEFRDLETGTTWTILGKAIEGELAGQQLELLPHRNEFWFAWQAFFPDAGVWEG